jgi:predicted patatin/cPLA2 family phospholipase
MNNIKNIGEKRNSDGKDLIFIFFGGGMKGVFSAGVVTTMENLNLYDRVHSIYAVSAGAHDAAFFLAKETQIGSTIYYEDLLDGGKFINNNRSKFYKSFILNSIKKEDKFEKLMDIDYLMDIEKNKKILNIEKISESKIPFSIRLFNCQTRREEWVDGKTDIFKKLQAAAAVIPFYPSRVEINGVAYFDGDTLSEIIDPVLEKVINDNPDKKIFIVLNTSKENRFSMLSLVEDILWTILLLIFVKQTYILRKLNIFREKRRLEKYCKLPNVKIIDPDFDVSEFCIDKDEEMKLYRNGVKKTEKIMAENGIKNF